jgi:hypothetical protein
MSRKGKRSSCTSSGAGNLLVVQRLKVGGPVAQKGRTTVWHATQYGLGCCPPDQPARPAPATLRHLLLPPSVLPPCLTSSTLLHQPGLRIRRPLASHQSYVVTPAPLMPPTCPLHAASPILAPAIQLPKCYRTLSLHAITQHTPPHNQTTNHSQNMAACRHSYSLNQPAASHPTERPMPPRVPHPTTKRCSKPK